MEMLKIYQNLEYIGGIPVTTKEDIQEVTRMFKLTKENIWFHKEVTEIAEYITKEVKGKLMDEGCTLDSILYIREYLNNKRALAYTDAKGINRLFILPRTKKKDGLLINDLSYGLFNAALKYIKTREEEDKKAAFENFERSLQELTMKITNRFLSKDSNLLYKFRFRGYTTTAMPSGNVTQDEILLPLSYAEKKGIRIGDRVLVTRDPVQNIVATLKVAGFTEQEEETIRINVNTYSFLDGDFDGDAINVIPIKALQREVLKYIKREEVKKIIEQNAEDSLPSNLFSKESRFERLVVDYDYTAGEKTAANYATTKGLLMGGEKSLKFCPKQKEDRTKELHIENILNMRTVAEGTAVAGSATNKVFEIAKVLGLDLVAARRLGSCIETASLDAKHSGHGDYRDADFYKLASLIGRKNKYSLEKIKELIRKALTQEKFEEVVEEENLDDLFD